MLLQKKDIQNLPYVLRIIKMLKEGTYIGRGTLVSDGIKVSFKSDVDSISGDIYNHDSHSPTVFFVVDNCDLFDEDLDQKRKGIEVNVSTEGFFIDLCGIERFTFLDKQFAINDGELESVLFQLSTTNDNIPDPTFFCTRYNEVKNFLLDSDLKFMNYISYDDCTILESDFEELQDEYKKLYKSKKVC